MSAPPPRLSASDLVGALEPPSPAWRTRNALRDSAVLLTLVERDGVDHVLYNVRREDLPAHAGQVCFPGGAREGDEDAVTCALRETEEELGLPRDALEVVARLPDRVSIAGFLVVPFVARLDRPRPYRPDAAEVADVFEVPLPALLERPRWSFRDTTHKMVAFRQIPFFDYGTYTVWGLTGIITRDFVRAVCAFDPGP